MRNQAQILIADDDAASREILRQRLAGHGYEILTASDGEEALFTAKETHPDLILLDIMMPKMDGIEVARHLRSDTSLPFMPIVMVTARSDPQDVVAALEAGADEYLTKPVDQTALVARVKSMLRIKHLHDTSHEQAAQLAAWNRRLEERVAAQLGQLEQLSHLKRFFSPQLAEYIISSADEKIMASHRREITVVFCDLRGFTAFSASTEPEDVMRVLREYHEAVGPLIFRFEATLEHFAGDGLTVFFNDPLPCPDPAARAVRMAVAMEREVHMLTEIWRKRGYELGFAVGIAHGYATLGQIGFEGQFHYGAIGPVLNLASRLCETARSGQILITQRVHGEVEDVAEVEPIEALELKGFPHAVPAFNVMGLKPDLAAG